MKLKITPTNLFSMGPKRSLFIVASLVIVLIASINGYLQGTQTFTLRTKKFIMPGTKEVYLADGDYMVWYFSKWAQKGINNLDGDKIVEGATNDLRIRIVPDVNLTMVEGAGVHLDPLREGVALGTIQVLKSGIYEISASNADEKPFVLALVPAKHHYFEITGTFSFKGLNDNEFEPTPSSLIEVSRARRDKQN